MEGERDAKKRSTPGDDHQEEIGNTTLIHERETNLHKENEKTGDQITRANGKFYIDYSIRGTAKCKVSKKIIEQDKLKIGKSVPYKNKINFSTTTSPVFSNNFIKPGSSQAF